MNTQPWIVVYTSGGNEFTFRDEATRLGIECYVPVHRRVSKPKRKRAPVYIERPAFANYAFLRVAPGQAAAQIKGFWYIVSELGGISLRLKQGTIDGIKLLEAGGFFDGEGIWEPGEIEEIRAGSIVEIFCGPLKGRIGRVEEILKRKLNQALISVEGWRGSIPLDFLRIFDDLSGRTIMSDPVAA